jgi:hypothetical protein
MLGGMRPVLALVAMLLSALAGVVSVLDGDFAVAPYFLVTTVAGGIVALGLTPGDGMVGLILARLLAILWLLSVFVIGTLLVFERITCGCSQQLPVPPNLYLGLPATAYHLIATFGSTALIVIAAFGHSVRARAPAATVPPITQSVRR